MIIMMMMMIKKMMMHDHDGRHDDRPSFAV
jgi:hypothetical protein